jgi:non-ribosomal peptide synthetase component F
LELSDTIASRRTSLPLQADLVFDTLRSAALRDAVSADIFAKCGELDLNYEHGDQSPWQEGNCMERIWLKSYSPGVPADVNVGAYQSIVEIFEQSVQRYSGKPAYVQMGATLSYSEVEHQSRAFAAYLTEGLGLERGARVALMMPNILQYPITPFGALRGGCVVVN